MYAEGVGPGWCGCPTHFATPLALVRAAGGSGRPEGVLSSLKDRMKRAFGGGGAKKLELINIVEGLDVGLPLQPCSLPRGAARPGERCAYPPAGPGRLRRGGRAAEGRYGGISVDRDAARAAADNAHGSGAVHPVEPRGVTRDRA